MTNEIIAGESTDPQTVKLIGHGTNGSDGIESGIHLRWAFNHKLGFPDCIRLFRRPTFVQNHYVWNYLTLGYKTLLLPSTHDVPTGFYEFDFHFESIPGVASFPIVSKTFGQQYKAQLWAGDESQIYEFAFLTSRYASFLHHIHDFKDAVWDHMALLNNPMFEIDTAALNAALQNADGLEEQVQFEQLMRVFDLSPRPLPQQLEISLLNDKNQSYGLLLESPEPLPAERVQGITLSMTGLSETIDEFDHTLKLIRAGIQRVTPPGGGGKPDYNKQWVEVLLLEKVDLSGYRIEYRDNTAREDEAFNLYYTSGRRAD
jgi:hypothetical protein